MLVFWVNHVSRCFFFFLPYLIKSKILCVLGMKSMDQSFAIKNKNQNPRNITKTAENQAVNALHLKKSNSFLYYLEALLNFKEFLNFSLWSVHHRIFTVCILLLFAFFSSSNPWQGNSFSKELKRISACLEAHSRHSRNALGSRISPLPLEFFSWFVTALGWLKKQGGLICAPGAVASLPLLLLGTFKYKYIYINIFANTIYTYY